jgi:hypothetical protein
VAALPTNRLLGLAVTPAIVGVVSGHGSGQPLGALSVVLLLVAARHCGGDIGDNGGGDLMRRTKLRPRMVIAAYTAATLATLLYTVGAPWDIS